MQTSNHNGFANRRLQAYCITPFCLRYWNQNISPRRFSVTLEMVYGRLWETELSRLRRHVHGTVYPLTSGLRRHCSVSVAA